MHKTMRRRAMIAAAVVAALVATDAVFAAGTLHVVSQRKRLFAPDTMTIQRGDTLRIVNDDGDLMHHAFIKNPAFSYDSGDQEPGSKSDVVFTKAGSFMILCGIHPKMKMTVTVTE